MGQSGKALRGAKDDGGADDVKRQVDSDDNHQLPIYQLVNVKNGGGKLIDLLKSSSKFSSSSFAFSKSADHLHHNQLTKAERREEYSVSN